MTDEDTKERVSLLHTTVFGAEGQGGLVREVEGMKARLLEAEKKINVVSGKWLAVMTLLGIFGQMLAKLLIH